MPESGARSVPAMVTISTSIKEPTELLHLGLGDSVMVTLFADNELLLVTVGKHGKNSIFCWEPLLGNQ